MCSDGYPIGINIPNYDEIRMNVGFKNVTLTNVMSSVKPNSRITKMLHPSAREIFMELSETTLTLSVAAHELYGHGTGKLLKKSDIEKEKIPDLLFPDEFISTYWPEGITYDVGFGTISQSFEECKAEATSLYLVFFDEVLDIFDISKDKTYRNNYKLVSIYHMLLSSLRSMFCYHEESRQWKQAHAAARFAILRACMIWGKGSVQLKKTEDNYLELFIDPNNLQGVKDALIILLKHLNYYKSSFQPGPAKEFFGALTSFDSFWLDIKKICDKEPRRRPVYCGGIVIKENNNKLNIKPFTIENPTILDSTLSVLTNIKIALH